ncbi:MAG: hypothetical protein AB7R55_11555 [Gemmatimonadales bacterium]
MEPGHQPGLADQDLGLVELEADPTGATGDEDAVPVELQAEVVPGDRDGDGRTGA